MKLVVVMYGGSYHFVETHLDSPSSFFRNVDKYFEDDKGNVHAARFIVSVFTEDEWLKRGIRHRDFSSGNIAYMAEVTKDMRVM